MIIKTKTAEETIKLGVRLGKLLQKGMIITLAGDLGAGKTTFTKGLGEGMEIAKAINSPTFTIMKIYNGRLPLYHIDAYRLEELHQDLGFEEYIEGDGVCVIEWANFINDLIPQDYLEIKIQYLNDSERQIELIPHGTKYEKLIEVM